MLFSSKYLSPIGPLLLAGDGRKLVGLWMEGQKYFGASVTETLVVNDALPLFAVVCEWLDEYFAGGRPAIERLPLAPRGSDFRQAVWRRLCAIPYGTTLSYGEIATEVAALLHKPGMSGQAVGGAVGHNPISIIIPCHRVVGRDGSLTGYAGGLERKIRLLELEGVRMERLYVPARGTAL